LREVASKYWKRKQKGKTVDGEPQGPLVMLPATECLGGGLRVV
jgi:hypothetical protein